MKKQEHLYFLIQSLSPAEKRYFKIFSDIHGKEEKNYLLLFDTLSKAKEYNEKIIKKKFNKKGFVNNFHVIKKELFDLILKSLANYHAANNARTHILQLMQQSHLLSQKGLDIVAQPLLLKAIDLAKKYFHYGLLLELYKLYNASLYTTNIDDKELAYIQHLLKEKSALLPILQEENELQEMLSLFKYEIQQQKKITSKPNAPLIIDIEKILNNDEAKLQSFHSENIFLVAAFLFYYRKGALDKAIMYGERAIKPFEKNTYLIQEYASKYLQAVYNTALCYLAIKQYKKSIETIDKLMLIQSHELDIVINIFTHKYIVLTACYLSMENFEAVIALEDEIEAGMKQYNFKIEPYRLHALRFNLASAYFGLNKFGKTISYLNKILNTPKELLNEDIYVISELMFVLSHYELKNYELIRSLIKSASKHFENLKIDWDIEQTVFNAILTIDDNTTVTEKIKTLKKLKSEVGKLIKGKPAGFRSTNYAYLMDWINEKLKP
jgi:tetratricopeptide (TPR) repeat protein